MELPVTYKNVFTSQYATETQLRDGGVNVENHDVMETLGWKKISYPYPDYNKWTEQMLPNGEPVLNKDKSGYTQQFKVVALDEDALQNNLATLAKQKANEARAAADAATAPYMAEFSDVEKQTWAKQQAEVAAYLADDTAATPTLDGLAQARGIGRDLMLEKAIAKVTAFEPLSVAIVGKQQAYEDAIKAIAADESKDTKTRITDLLALVFDYSLGAAGSAEA